VAVPVIASGGAGGIDDVVAVLSEGGASAALLASLLHMRRIEVGQLKEALADRGISVRPVPTPVTPGEIAGWLG
jgi:cyclase